MSIKKVGEGIYIRYSEPKLYVLVADDPGDPNKWSKEPTRIRYVGPFNTKDERMR